MSICQKPKVLVPDHVHQRGVRRLQEECDVLYAPGMSREEILRAIASVDAIIVRSGVKVDAEMISAGAGLKVIGRAGTGVDNIDVERATERGILVVNAPNGNTVAACEHTFALMLALARHLPRSCESLKRGEWKRSSFVGVELRGKTLGVVGLGRIGSEVARRAKSFGMEVVAYDPYVSTEVAGRLGVALVDLDDLLRRSDFVTLHVPLTPNTRHIIGRREISLLKPEARLINCARGGLVDERALYEALAEGRMAGAAVDVYEEEPPHGNPLLSLGNVVATPHLGASTSEAQEQTALAVAEQVILALRGEFVYGAVNLPALVPEELAALKRYIPAAEALGSFYAQACPGPINEVEIGFGEELSGTRVEVLKSFVLKGLLRSITDHINHINAAEVARRRGIKVVESKGAPRGAISLSVRPREGSRVAGVAVGPQGEVRLVMVDDQPIDVMLSPRMLVTRHHDRPGMIGKIGAILGSNGINIAAMQLGRRSVRGEAVMVLEVDDPVPDHVVKAIKEIDGIFDAKAITLHPGLLNWQTPQPLRGE